MLTEKRDNVGTMKYIEEYETVKFILNYMNLNFEPQELEQEIPSEDQKMYETIRAIKQEFDIKEAYAPEIKISNEIYLLEEVLKEYRLERGLTITQAAEGVCDGKTYRALENGKRKPKRGTYKAIAEKFGIPLVKYNADIITDQYEYLEMLHEIKLISRKDVKGREQKLIDILEYKLGEWMNKCERIEEIAEHWLMVQVY